MATTRARTHLHSRTALAALLAGLALATLTLVTAASASARSTSAHRASAHAAILGAQARRCATSRRHARRRVACLVRSHRSRKARTSDFHPFQVGIAAWRGSQGQLDSTTSVGAKLVRVEFPIDSTVDDLRPVIAGQAEHGARVLPLAGFAGRIPTAAQARNLATWAHAFGPGGTFWAGRSDGEFAVTRIEFGNETSFGYQYGDQFDQPSYAARARKYALRFKDAQDAIQSHAGAPGVGLLAQADDAGNKSSIWVRNMFAAVPDLGSRVAGWTIHPYGPAASWKPRIDRLIAQTAAQGAPSSIPIDITEWGLSSDNGRCVSDNYEWSKCMGYQAAASTLHDTIGAMRARYGARLQTIMLYMVTDLARPGATHDRENYFGALTTSGGDKGAYTREIRAQLAGTA